ncbi:hypothetical protein GCM10023192_30280 [Amycolatopsis samaneae]
MRIFRTAELIAAASNTRPGGGGAGVLVVVRTGGGEVVGAVGGTTGLAASEHPASAIAPAQHNPITSIARMPGLPRL